MGSGEGTARNPDSRGTKSQEWNMREMVREYNV